MARIGIIGSTGRMGQALAEAIAAAGDTLSGGIDKGGDPLALAQAHMDGRIKPGQLVLIEAMGGGFTWGSALIRW